MNISMQRISVPDKSDVWRVSLLGQSSRMDDTADLCALLATPDVQSIDISCFDTDTLPVPLLEAIAAALDRDVDVKLRAYRPLLAFALSRLSLPVLMVPPQPPQALLTQCRAVALAGSANSLDKILAIVESLPNSEASIFIAQHIQEDQPNLLDQLLKMRTEYSVVMPHSLTTVQPHTIYVAPPGHHMKVAHGLVYLTRDRKVKLPPAKLEAYWVSPSKGPLNREPPKAATALVSFGHTAHPLPLGCGCTFLPSLHQVLPSRQNIP